MRKWMWLFSLLIFIYSPLGFAAKAIVLEINGPIGPATQDYIERGIAYAEDENATLVVLQLNTPGGLESVMRNINADIVKSPIPIVTYVAPTGARAASAGTFLLYASHIAAMAPGTNLGAASPVNLGGNNDGKNLSISEQKALNDAAAYLRSLGQLRGRNTEWADLAVRQAASLSAEEAKREHVIDFIAPDYPSLFHQIHNRSVTIAGQTKKIDTTNIVVEKKLSDWRYDFLSFITNPNIAYLLMLLALYGLFFELSNPGLILPGVAGVIALVLCLYALQLLPINYAGLALIAVGIGFMISEVYITSFGALGIGGVIAFILGSIMLFDIQDQHFALNWSLVIAMSLLTLAFFLSLTTMVIRSQKRTITTGREGLLGKEGVVIEVMNQQIIVRVLGETWDARCVMMLQRGDKVKVVGINGLTLTVVPLQKAGE